MSVLVTGGAGYVGRFIAEGLLQAGYAVTVAGRRPPAAGLFSKPVAFRRLDLEPTADHAALLDGLDHLVHGALHHVPGRYRGGEGSDAATFTRLNLDGAITLFEAAKAAGVRRAIFLSSRAVYGVHEPDAVLSEDMECRPDTLYGQVKLDAEQALATLASLDFVATSLRVTGVYGAPRPGGRHKWETLFSDYLAGKPIAPRAGTEVHGRDVAEAARLILEGTADAVSGQTFNVSDVLVDRHDLLALVKSRTGCPHPLPDHGEVSGASVMTSERLRALGWQPGGRDLVERMVEQCLSASD